MAVPNSDRKAQESACDSSEIVEVPNPANCTTPRQEYEQQQSMPDVQIGDEQTMSSCLNNLLSGIARTWHDQEQKITTEHDEERDIWKAELIQTLTKNEDLQQRVNGLTHQNNHLTFTVRGQKNTLTVYKTKVANFRKFVDGLGNDLDSLKHSADSQRKQSDQLSQIVKEQRETQIALHQELASCVTRSNQLKANLLKNCQDINKDFEVSQAHLKYLEQQLHEKSGLLAEERDLRARLLADQTSINTFASTTAELQEKLEASGLQLSNIMTQLSTSQSTERIQEENTALQAKLASLQDRSALQELEVTELGSIRANLQAKESMLESLRSDLDERKQELNVQESTAHSLRTEIEELQKRLEDMSSAISAFELEREQLKQQSKHDVETLRLEMSDHARRFYTEQRCKADNEFKKVSYERDAALSQLAQSQETLNRLLQTADLEKDSLTKEIETLRLLVLELEAKVKSAAVAAETSEQDSKLERVIKEKDALLRQLEQIQADIIDAQSERESVTLSLEDSRLKHLEQITELQANLKRAGEKAAEELKAEKINADVMQKKFVEDKAKATKSIEALQIRLAQSEADIHTQQKNDLAFRAQIEQSWQMEQAKYERRIAHLEDLISTETANLSKASLENKSSSPMSRVAQTPIPDVSSDLNGQQACSDSQPEIQSLNSLVDEVTDYVGDSRPIESNQSAGARLRALVLKHPNSDSDNVTDTDRLLRQGSLAACSHSNRSQSSWDEENAERTFQASTPRPNSGSKRIPADNLAFRSSFQEQTQQKQPGTKNYRLGTPTLALKLKHGADGDLAQSLGRSKKKRTGTGNASPDQNLFDALNLSKSVVGDSDQAHVSDSSQLYRKRTGSQPRMQTLGGRMKPRKGRSSRQSNKDDAINGRFSQELSGR